MATTAYASKSGVVAMARRFAWTYVGFVVACSIEAEPAQRGALEPEAPRDHIREGGVTRGGGQRAKRRTTLSLVLLATLASQRPGEGSATIRDPEAATVATYRVGATIREGVVLVAIAADHVVLEHARQRERLDFDAQPAVMASGDTYYPDFDDPNDWPNRMADAVQLRQGFGYAVKRPAHAWGTPLTIHVLREAIGRFHRDHPNAPQVHVGDLSRKRGGLFPPHLSHQDGRDVDIGYVLRGPKAHRVQFSVANGATLDHVRTWGLLRALLRHEVIQYVFVDYEIQRRLYDYAKHADDDPQWLATIFQYPRGSHAAHGVIRHWPGHDDHMHVRVKQTD